MPVPPANVLAPPPGAPAAAPVSDTIATGPNHTWFYVFFGDHPSHWAVREIVAGEGVPDEDVGRWWLPVLDAREARPGVSGNRTRKAADRADRVYAGAHARILTDGGTVLYPERVGSYSVPWPCRHPVTGESGVYHADVWSTPRAPVRGQRLGWDFDSQRHYRWVLSLVRAGHLPEIRPEFVATHREIAESKIARRAALDLDPARKAAHVAEAEAEARRVDAATVAPRTDRPTPPARRKGAAPPPAGA